MLAHLCGQDLVKRYLLNAFLSLLISNSYLLNYCLLRRQGPNKKIRLLLIVAVLMMMMKVLKMKTCNGKDD